MLYEKNKTASQAWEAGSIPVSRSFFLIIKLNTNLL